MIQHYFALNLLTRHDGYHDNGSEGKAMPCELEILVNYA